MFFGRTRARNELREVLARQAAHGSAFVLVLGASGRASRRWSRRAGPRSVLPGMIGRVGLCRRAIMRPGEPPADLCEAFQRHLAPTALPELAPLRYPPDGSPNC